MSADTPTQAITRLDWPRMLGRAAAHLGLIAARAEAVADCISSPDTLRAELRTLAAQACEAANLHATKPITRER